MDCNGSLGILTNIKELEEDGIARSSAIHKEEIVMTESHVFESLRIVQLVIQSDDRCDILSTEIRNVGFWRVDWIAW